MAETREYRRKPCRVKATRWRGPGDHHGVRFSCGMWTASVRGHEVWVEPGDWILTHEDGSLSVMSDAAFRRSYAPVETDAAPAIGDATRMVMEGLKSILTPNAATVYAYCGNDGVAVLASDLRAALRECGLEVEP